MKLKIISMDGTEKGAMDLPVQFNEPVREDLIKRAVLAIQAARRQPYGADPEAGKRSSAYVSKRRRAYKGTYGIGQSRTPRKVMSRNGTRFNFVGAFAPQTVGGRRSHPPKASKIWEQKLNKTENRKAIRAALASTINTELVKSRGHKAPANYPFIISNDFEKITKTKDLKSALDKLGFEEELKRTAIRKIRAGIGKTRGRKYKTKKGILFITADSCDLSKAGANIPGTDIITVKSINTEYLAPGAVPGRLTLYTESAIKKLAETKIFTPAHIAPKTEKKAKPAKKEKTKSADKPAKKTRVQTAVKQTPKNVAEKTTTKEDKE